MHRCFGVCVRAADGRQHWGGQGSLPQSDELALGAARRRKRSSSRHVANTKRSITGERSWVRVCAHAHLPRCGCRMEGDAAAGRERARDRAGTCKRGSIAREQQVDTPSALRKPHPCASSDARTCCEAASSAAAPTSLTTAVPSDGTATTGGCAKFGSSSAGGSAAGSAARSTSPLDV